MIRLKNVLVATDFGEPAGVALMYGRDLARTFGARLHVLYVAPDLGGHFGSYSGNASAADLSGLQAEMEDTAQERLDDLLTDEDRVRLQVRPTLIRSTTGAAQVIAKHATDISADVIVIGTHGRSGAAHFLMGSVAERVVRLAPCPVLTVRHPEHEFVLPDALQTTAHNR